MNNMSDHQFVTDLERRLASDASGSVAVALRADLNRELAALEENRQQLLPPEEYKEYESARRAIRSALLILDRIAKRIHSSC